MSTEVASQNMQHFFCEIYQSEWTVTNLSSYEKKKLVTPSFSPSPYLDVKFCLEVIYSKYIVNYQTRLSLTKIFLIKLYGSFVFPSAKLEIEMSVLDSNGSLIKEFRKLPIIALKNMDNYCFDEIKGLPADELLVFELRMTFFGHLQNLPTNCLLPSILCSSEILETSSVDIKSYTRSDKFSDIIIGVASKLFFAHKIVLSHHSSVFKQMITQKPENEYILVTDDEMCDAFDSFLNYLYLGNFEDTSWPMVRDVYILAAKYQVDTLKKICGDAIGLNLSIDKICDVLKIACDNDDLNLKEIATKFAVDHIWDVTSSEEWKMLTASHPLVGYEVTFHALNVKKELK